MGNSVAFIIHGYSWGAIIIKQKKKENGKHREREREIEERMREWKKNKNKMKSNMKRKVIILIFLSPRILNSDKSPHSPTREIMRIQLFIYKTYFGNFSAVVVTFPSIRKAKTNTFKMMKLSNSIFKKKINHKICQTIFVIMTFNRTFRETIFTSQIYYGNLYLKRLLDAMRETY